MQISAICVCVCVFACARIYPSVYLYACILFLNYTYIFWGQGWAAVVWKLYMVLATTAWPMKSQHLILASIINRLAGKEIAWLLPTRFFHSDSRSKGGEWGTQKLAEGVRQGSIPSREQLPALQNYLYSIFFSEAASEPKIDWLHLKRPTTQGHSLDLGLVQPLQMKIALALYAMICLHLL